RDRSHDRLHGRRGDPQRRSLPPHRSRDPARRAPARGRPLGRDRPRGLGRRLGARSVRSHCQRRAVHRDRARRRGPVRPRGPRHRGSRRAASRRGARGSRSGAGRRRGGGVGGASGFVLWAGFAVPRGVGGMWDRARGEGARREAQRFLFIPTPAVTWQDIQARRDKLPNLIRLLDSSAVGGLTTRAVDRKTALAGRDVAMGAGTPSVGTEMDTDGAGLAAGEPFGAGTAGQAFERRTGRAPRRGLVNLGIAGIVDKNKQELFDAEIGALGDKLASADWSRAVIANGDGYDPEELPVGGYYRRQAVSGLMG